MATNNRKVRVKNANPIVIDGIRFGSEAEAYYYTQLKELKEDNQIQGFDMQVRYDLQIQFKKCGNGCGFIWERPDASKKRELERYKEAERCPQCDAQLMKVGEIYYVSDFDVINMDGSVHVVDVKSSEFFQTEVFKYKRKLFEWKYPNKILEMVFPKVPKGWGKVMRAFNNPENLVDNNGDPIKEDVELD